jgi:hypothetical protein
VLTQKLGGFGVIDRMASALAAPLRRRSKREIGESWTTITSDQSALFALLIRETSQRVLIHDPDHRTKRGRGTIAGMPILNYTTKIRPDRTTAEIQRMLGARGARRVTSDYRDGRIAAISFSLVVGEHEVDFRLPSNPDGVLRALKAQRVPRNYQNIEHAESVSWRIVKDWIEAQLALVEAQQAQMAEVFMPYAVVRGRTMFQLFEAQAAKGLLGESGVD